MSTSCAHPATPLVEAEELARLEPVSTLPGRNLTKADLRFYRLGRRRIAVKTYAPRPFWVRHVVGRWLIRRETAAYQAAAGLPGLPAFLGRLGAYTLATEWVDAEPLRSFRGRPLDSRVFDALAAIVDGLHRRGVAVADLHHRDVLLAPDGRVYLVDFAVAWRLGERPGRLRRSLFRRLQEQDRLAVERLRARWTGGDVDAASRAAGGAAAARHARGRRLKALVDRLRGKSRRAPATGPENLPRR